MSDDLAKEIARCALRIEWRDTETSARRVAEHAADRIAALEAEYAEFQASVKEREQQFALNMGKLEVERDALAEKLSLAVEAARSFERAWNVKINGKNLTDREHHAISEARATLAELEDKT